MTFIKWLASFFDETTPQSFSRLITLVIVAFILGWDTAYLRYDHKVIEGSTFAAQMVAAATFYGIRRLAGAKTDTPGAPAAQEMNSGNTQGTEQRQ